MLRDADRIVGTSAGSVVGAQLCSGEPLESLCARQLVPAEQSTELAVEFDVEAIANVVITALTEGLDAQQMRVRMGAFALATDTVPESVRRAVIEARLSSHDWTDRELIVTAVHAHSGEFVTFDRHGAVGLVDAVTASCAVPGVWPPVSIDGARYIDGGVRSGVNLDLAAGADVVVVLAPSAMGFGGSVHDEAEPLRSAGAVVEVIVADEGSLAAFGTNVLDPATRAPSLAEGRRQGAEAAERLRAVWR